MRRKDSSRGEIYRWLMRDVASAAHKIDRDFPLRFFERSRARPSGRFDEFSERILRRAASMMPTPPPPVGPGGDPGGGGGFFGGGGSSSGAVAATAANAGIAATAGARSGDALPWVFPSSDFLNFMKYGTVALPSQGGNPAIIVSFKVPNGRYGKISGIGIDFVANGATAGGLFTQGVLPAQLNFTLAADGVPFQDLGNFTYMPGEASAPLGIAGLMIREAQLITLTVQNIGVTVATQFVEAMLTGYYYSKNLQPKGMSYQ